jgi:outer membrane receptor protein involved in Fe transport
MVVKNRFVVFLYLATAVSATTPGDLSPPLPPPGEMLYAGEDIVAGFGYGDTSLRETPARVEIIGGEEIRAYGYRDLGEALETLAGLYVMEVPGRESPGATVTMRGADPGQVLLLIDDVPVGNLLYGWHDLLTVPLETVDHVEVIYGPDAVRYGDGTLAGAVHVYTMKGPRESARSQLSAADGSFDTERYRFNFGMTTRGVDLFFGGNRLFGHEPNTGERISLYNIDGRVAYRWVSGDADVSYGMYRRRTPVLDRYKWDVSSAPGEQQEHADRLRGRVRFGFGPGSFGVTGYYRREFLRFDDVFAGFNYAERGREANGTLVYSLPHGAASAANWRLAGTYRQDLHSRHGGTVLSVAFVEDYRAPFPLRFRVGAAYDYYKNVGGVFSPDARVSFLPSDWVTVYGGYSAGVRFPALGFINRNVGGETVEKNRNLEVGVKVFAKGHLTAGVSAYRDLAEQAWLPDKEIRADKLERLGGEVWAEGRLPIDVFCWGVSYGRANVEYDGGKRVSYKPADTAFGRFGYLQRLFRGDMVLRAEVTANYVGPRLAYGYKNHGSFKVKYDRKTYLEDLPAYWLLGTHFSVTVISVEVFVDMENINRTADYWVRPEYHMPAGVRTYVGFLWTMYD